MVELILHAGTVSAELLSWYTVVGGVKDSEWKDYLDPALPATPPPIGQTLDRDRGDSGSGGVPPARRTHLAWKGSEIKNGCGPVMLFVLITVANPKKSVEKQ